ncbi:HNH endonuclease, partial [Streptomyces sp. NPDC006798]
MVISLKRAVSAAALVLVPLALTTPATAATPVEAAPPAGAGATAGARAAAPQTVPILLAVNRLSVRTEDRTGYERSKFKHWNSGLEPDGCNTRNEVLIDEAVTAPTV